MSYRLLAEPGRAVPSSLFGPGAGTSYLRAVDHPVLRMKGGKAGALGVGVGQVGFGELPRRSFPVDGEGEKGRERHQLLVKVRRIGGGIAAVNDSYNLLKGCLEIINVCHRVLLLRVR